MPMGTLVIDQTLPPVSVVLPTLNERGYVTDCLTSLLAQDYPAIDEILVVDGGSDDGTQAIAESFGGPVRVVDNPRVTAAAAMNVGLAAAASELIVRVDAHTVYDVDYVRRSIEALAEQRRRRRGRPDAGRRHHRLRAGRRRGDLLAPRRRSRPLPLRPGGARTSRRSTSAPTGGPRCTKSADATRPSSNGRPRTRSSTTACACRAAESASSPRSGRPTSPDRPRTRCGASTCNYGLCKASTLKKHRTLPYWRPLAPAALVAGTIGAVVVGTATRRPALALAPAAAWAGAAGVAALRMGEDPGVAPHRAFAALAICHWGYGLGFWRGIGRILTGRPFDTRPRRGGVPRAAT